MHCPLQIDLQHQRIELKPFDFETTDRIRRKPKIKTLRRTRTTTSSRSSNTMRIRSNRFPPPKAESAPRERHASRKRKSPPLALAVYDPAAAEQRAAAASLLSLTSARALALVPFLPQPPVAPRDEPPWLRDLLGVRLDLTVHFIGEKAVTVTDLDKQQNRFRLPTEDVLSSLRPILIAEELDAANIPRVGALQAPRLPPPPPKTDEEELLLLQEER